MTAKKKSVKLLDLARLHELGVSITNLVSDSRKIKPGDTFVAYAGEKSDGRKFIPDAISAGASSICGTRMIFLGIPHGVFHLCLSLS